MQKDVSENKKKKSFYKFNEKCTDILKFKIFTLKNLFKYLTL